MMINSIEKHLNFLFKRFPSLKHQEINLKMAFQLLVECFERGGKVLVAGNGGSASDSEHIVGELMKSFERERPLSRDIKEKLKAIDFEMGTILSDCIQEGLTSLSLTGHYALSTAYMNDCRPEMVFAQQVNGFGKKGDLFFALSTSGNSKNLVYAAIMAKAKGMKIISLTGAKESKLSSLSDVTIKSSESRTFLVQEQHLPIYHCLCLMLEDYFFGD